MLKEKVEKLVGCGDHGIVIEQEPGVKVDAEVEPPLPNLQLLVPDASISEDSSTPPLPKMSKFSCPDIDDWILDDDIILMGQEQQPCMDMARKEVDT